MTDIASEIPEPREPRAGPRPVGPPALPFLGHVFDYSRDPLGFWTRTARHYGDIVPLNFAGWPGLLVSDVDAIEDILVRDHRSYIKHQLMWRHATALFGQGLLTSEGAFWQRQRRLAAPPFAGRQLLAYDAGIVGATSRMLEGWRDGETLDVHSRMMNLTLRIVANTLFDTELEGDVADLEQALDVLAAELEARFSRPFVIPDYVPLPGNRRYRRAIRTVEAVVTRMIAARRAEGCEKRNDLLSRLMAARDENGQPMSDTRLRDEAVTLLLAGHETTAVALSWTWYLIGQRPEVRARMTAEIDQAIGGRPATSGDLPNLGFTENVLMEAMRLYPPAWTIGRQSTKATVIGGHAYPAGTSVFISPWILHRDERHFDRADEFRPDRWSGDLAQRLPRFAYMPFGGGPRICIGQRFAMMEAMLILATMLQHVDAEWQGMSAITPQPSITLRPIGGVQLRVRRRSAGSRGND
ncbi:cytochrome P450 [Rubellimicrobium roseum]|uniref:Cytochrome P450 n=1 Tax=Rubellimicrobium roseum TaxID=687525 RepID=A0A5C4NAW4_9RHOB|nr:cytochrome P450 [Rubellimicrobium roseum]TNC63491.1 cytochrome P450 [Rubellimicrobium roseum]